MLGTVQWALVGAQVKGKLTRLTMTTLESLSFFLLPFLSGTAVDLELLGCTVAAAATLLTPLAGILLWAAIGTVVVTGDVLVVGVRRVGDCGVLTVVLVTAVLELVDLMLNSVAGLPITGRLAIGLAVLDVDDGVLLGTRLLVGVANLPLPPVIVPPLSLELLASPPPLGLACAVVTPLPPDVATMGLPLEATLLLDAMLLAPILRLDTVLRLGLVNLEG